MRNTRASASGPVELVNGRVWTLDVGNSRAKLRCWIRRGDGDAWRREDRDPSSDEWSLEEAPSALARALEHARQGALDTASVGGGPRVALSCVASPQLEKTLADALAERLGARFLGTPDSGLVNLCDPAQGVGRDRLFAARGAFERLGRSAHVVDVGSAVTVDVLFVEERAPGAQRAEFRGGAIAPGPALLAASLQTRTARLPAVEARPRVNAVGRDTQAAIAAGVFHGLRGAVRELVERADDELQLGRLAIVLTGGAAPWLLDPPLFPDRTVLHEPELVHIGLLHAAVDVLEARARGHRSPVEGP